MKYRLLFALMLALMLPTYAQNNLPRADDYQLIGDGQKQKRVDSGSKNNNLGKAERLEWKRATILSVLVSPEGEVKSVEIAKSSGSKKLDSAAVKAAKEGRFKPSGVWTMYSVPVQINLYKKAT